MNRWRADFVERSGWSDRFSLVALDAKSGAAELPITGQKNRAWSRIYCGTVYRRTDVSVARAAALTKQLLGFSRRRVINPQVLSLSESIAGVELMLQRLVGAGIKVMTRPGHALGKVKIDPGQVEQILMNLAVNARDAMLHGGKFTIETTNVELDAAYARIHLDVKPGSYVKLPATHSVAGMDGTTMSRIFEPFFTTKELGKGTGLGLSMVFGIVKQSGGHVVVDSKPGTGTTFNIYLPTVGVAVDDRRSAPPVVESEPHTGTILLVEDENEVRILTRTLLHEDGYVVLDAANAGEALLLSEEYPDTIDLLVTAVVLPRMSGRQLAERLAPARPDMKVLYMSAHTDEALRHHGIIASDVTFLRKPFTPTRMTDKVWEVIKLKRPLA